MRHETRQSIAEIFKDVSTFSYFVGLSEPLTDHRIIAGYLDETRERIEFILRHRGVAIDWFEIMLEPYNDEAAQEACAGVDGLYEWAYHHKATAVFCHPNIAAESLHDLLADNLIEVDELRNTEKYHD